MPFLVELGVMTSEGKVRSRRYDKFRQVNRFLELVEDVLPALPSGPLRIVDFGSGKSYLTFALHHLLTVVHGREVEIVGLDLKPEVVGHCETLARTLGADGLRFEVGDIAGYEALAGVDLVVSLHACDTATDDALDRAVRAGAPVILAVPCCQHELLPQLENRALAPLLRHGTLRERFAAEVTDAARAQLLGAVGYDVQVVEFIELEHTAEERPPAGGRAAGPGHGEGDWRSTAPSRPSSGSTRPSPDCSPTSCRRDRAFHVLRLVARGLGAARGDCDGGDELARRRGARSLGERRSR